MTIEQARELTSFELAAPKELPSYLEFMAATVTSSPNAPDSYNMAVLYYEIPESDSQRASVQLSESSHNTQPAVSGDDAVEEQLTIASTQVMKIVQTNAGGIRITSYSWTVNDVSMSILAMVEPPITDADLEQMIASMLK